MALKAPNRRQSGAAGEVIGHARDKEGELSGGRLMSEGFSLLPQS
jgi:hypothetical protein